MCWCSGGPWSPSSSTSGKIYFGFSAPPPELSCGAALSRQMTRVSPGCSCWPAPRPHCLESCSRSESQRPSKAVSLFLLGTAALLAISEWVGRHLRSMSSLRWPDALLIGLAQSLALFPGISRSGATIAGGLARNMERAEAARFSFLMSVPIMVGAGVIALIDLSEAPDASAQLQTLAAGSLAAAIVGYLAIRWLLRYLSERPLTVFIYYCAAAGLGGLILSLLRG
jgi:undecaprenyl pyrophosphate phosphatase UppP